MTDPWNKPNPDMPKEAHPTASTGAAREALGALSLCYLPLEALYAAAAAFTYGDTEKYDARNWEKGLPIQQLIDSTRRHLDNIERRQDIDTGDSELPETCLFMASAMMLVASLDRGIGVDDRLVAPSSGRTPKELAQLGQLYLKHAATARKRNSDPVVKGPTNAL